MSNAVEQLYYHFCETIELDEESQKKQKALAIAKLAIIDELEHLDDGKYRHLLDVLATLEGQSEELRSRALFAAALETGMALGRLQVS